ncbi:MAG: helix-turn-helix transcriptional regulator [Clostridia bacterium]|nr:helix-turn-helix transcriptional regulator [Clostridia bacterium]
MNYFTNGNNAIQADTNAEALRKRRIGIRLAELRGDKTQGTVAEKLGVSTAAISMYENGKRMPKDTLKRRIANLYGKSVEEIFFAE